MKRTEMAAASDFKMEDDVTLQPMEQSHASQLFQLVDQNREFLRRWLPFVDEYHEVSAAIDFIRRFEQMSAKKTGLAFGIWVGGDLVGVITYDRFDWAKGTALIGFWMGEPFQGKGIMTKSVRTLADYAFNYLELKRVEIRCAAENVKCRAVPERLGFRDEGIVGPQERVNDRWLDMSLYSLNAAGSSQSQP